MIAGDNSVLINCDSGGNYNERQSSVPAGITRLPIAEFGSSGINLIHAELLLSNQGSHLTLGIDFCRKMKS